MTKPDRGVAARCSWLVFLDRFEVPKQPAGDPGDAGREGDLAVAPFLSMASLAHFVDLPEPAVFIFFVDTGLKWSPYFSLLLFGD